MAESQSENSAGTRRSSLIFAAQQNVKKYSDSLTSASRNITLPKYSGKTGFIEFKRSVTSAFSTISEAFRTELEGIQLGLIELAYQLPLELLRDTDTMEADDDGLRIIARARENVVYAVRVRMYHELYATLESEARSTIDNANLDEDEKCVAKIFELLESRFMQKFLTKSIATQNALNNLTIERAHRY